MSAAVFAGRDHVCFSHDWAGDPLSKTHIMRLLAKTGRVLWVNSIGYRAPTASTADLARAWKKLRAAVAPISQPIPNLYVVNPLAIPAWGSSAARAVNRRWLAWQVRRAMRSLGFSRPINWTFNPAAADLAGRLGEDRVIYYCVDEYTAFAGVPAAALAAMESRLIDRADLVVVSAEPLVAAKSRPNRPAHLVRHGVDFDHFRAALDPALPVPAGAGEWAKPVVGYFGWITADWFDVPLMERVARHISPGTLVLVGRVSMDLGELARLPNVKILGRQPYESLPSYCKAFGAAVIPFPRSEVTRHANPLKAREYLAAGLPVVSTPVPEVEALGLCRVGDTAEEFLRHLDAALIEPGPDARRSGAVAGQSWLARLDEVGRLFALVPGRGISP